MKLVSTFFRVNLENYSIERSLGSKDIIIVKNEPNEYSKLKPKMILSKEVIEEIIKLYKKPVEPIYALIEKKETIKKRKADPLANRKKRKRK